AAGARAEDPAFPLPPEFIGRSMIVLKAQRLDAECVVGGYIAGAAWADYEKSGRVFGVRMPPNLKESEAFPEPMFTPTTKAETGHDEAMSADELVETIGAEAANAVRLRTLAIYKYAVQYAGERGIIIADTKLEFGIVDGEPIVIDELLTPDSSRFWPADKYQPGGAQPSFDTPLAR